MQMSQMLWMNSLHTLIFINSYDISLFFPRYLISHEQINMLYALTALDRIMSHELRRMFDMRARHRLLLFIVAIILVILWFYNLFFNYMKRNETKWKKKFNLSAWYAASLIEVLFIIQLNL